jgi:phosphonopyruvate decarboxylase
MNNFIVGVPFSGMERYVNKDHLIATREDEAIAIAAGAWLAGKSPLVFMQDSGLGNSLDILTSLVKPYGISIQLLINERTEPEHHGLMGKVSRKLLEVIEYDEHKVKYC